MATRAIGDQTTATNQQATTTMVVMNNILRYHAQIADATSPRSHVSGKITLKAPQSRDFMDKMSRYTRASDRKNVLKTLKECSTLKMITLPPKPSFPSSEYTWNEMEQEVFRTRFDMNGIPLGPGCLSSSRFEIQKILKIVCIQLAEQNDSFAAEELYRELIVRLAESNSRAEAHRALDLYMASPQLQLQPLEEDPVAKPHINVSLYEANGQFHIVLDVHHSFGLFRKLDLGSGKPWIKVSAAFHERTNLHTGAAIRTVEVQLPSK